jgi:hypothetical protein
MVSTSPSSSSSLGGNAELVSGLEKRDRNHEGAGKRECVALSECKILCHVRNLRPERADPARWLLKGPGTVAIIAKAKPSDGSLLADPDRGLIDGDPDLVQDAIHKERDWFASEGQVVFGTGLPPEPQLQLRPASFRHAPSAIQPEQNKMRAGAEVVERPPPGFHQITEAKD